VVGGEEAAAVGEEEEEGDGGGCGRARRLRAMGDDGGRFLACWIGGGR